MHLNYQLNCFESAIINGYYCASANPKRRYSSRAKAACKQDKELGGHDDEATSCFSLAKKYLLGDVSFRVV